MTTGATTLHQSVQENIPSYTLVVSMEIDPMPTKLKDLGLTSRNTSLSNGVTYTTTLNQAIERSSR